VHFICPKPLNHVGICVSDLDGAILWYQNVLGYRLFSGPFDLTLDSPIGEQIQDVLGDRCEHVRIAHLSTGGGVGIELFQSVLPRPRLSKEDRVNFDLPGPFHICVTDPNIEQLITRISESGGVQISKIWCDRPPFDKYKMVYCKDPFGTVIEIHTHSYEVVQGWRESPAIVNL